MRSGAQNTELKHNHYSKTNLNLVMVKKERAELVSDVDKICSQSDLLSQCERGACGE